MPRHRAGLALLDCSNASGISGAFSFGIFSRVGDGNEIFNAFEQGIRGGATNKIILL